MAHGVNGVLALLPAEVDGKYEDDKSSITQDAVAVCWMSLYSKHNNATISAAILLVSTILGRVGQSARSPTIA
jgi:hypothetical protein